MKVVAIQEDGATREALERTLLPEGFALELFESGRKAFAEIARQPPDLVLFDPLISEPDALEFCRRLRRSSGTAHVPLVFLTSNGHETDRIVALELGADDYLTKPFSPRELVLRIGAILRRTKRVPPAPAPGDGLRRGDLVLYPDEQRLVSGDTESILTATENRLLALLVSRAGRIQSRESLVSEIWGPSPDKSNRTLDVYVHRLRAKLGRHARRLETVVGVGYRFR